MRVTDPKEIPWEEIAAGIEKPIGAVIQFSNVHSYDDRMLEKVNEACMRFDDRLQVRFYGHYGNVFDGKVLQHLPAVKSLAIDCLQEAKNFEELEKLRELRQLSFGVFQADMPHLLEMSSLRRLRKLVLVGNRRNNIDLAPLVSMGELEECSLNGHSKNIDVLAETSVFGLSLSSMRKSVALRFIAMMKRLEALRIMLGGRKSLAEVSSQSLENLSIVRVLGLESVSLEQMPGLKNLVIEDQLRLERLDLRPVRQSLETLSIHNCKQFKYLDALQEMERLTSLRLGVTAVDVHQVLASTPACLTNLSIYTEREKENRTIEQKVRDRGYGSAVYTGY